MPEHDQTPVPLDDSNVRLLVGRLVSLVEQRAIRLGQLTAAGRNPGGVDVLEASQLLAAARIGAVEGLCVLVHAGTPPVDPTGGGR